MILIRAESFILKIIGEIFIVKIKRFLN